MRAQRSGAEHAVRLRCGVPLPAELLLMCPFPADLTFGGSPAGPPILGVGVGAFTFTVRKVRNCAGSLLLPQSPCAERLRSLADAGDTHSEHALQLKGCKLQAKRQDCDCADTCVCFAGQHTYLLQ